METQRASPAVVEAAPVSVPVDAVEAFAFEIPLDEPESDGTLRWDAHTLVLVTAEAGGVTGIGYSYTHAAAARLIDDRLAEVVAGIDAMHVGAAWHEMHHAIRNLGRPGICASAIAAVDNALWDLKARLLGVSVADLLPASHASIPIYGSGGFTSYSIEELRRHCAEWVEQGIRMVKIKIGRHPDEDLDRVAAAREVVGDDVDLFVDANGAYSRKQALWFAEAFADYGVSWFEEPVSSDDLEGLRLLRDRGPAGMDVTAGEYGYDLFYFRHMLEAGAVDVLQADISRCAGLDGLLAAGALCQARSIDFSAHTVPGLHAHACCGIIRTRHIEYFRDHVRIERMLFDGVLSPEGGALRPDRSRPGFGLDFKWPDAEDYQVYSSTSR